MQVEARGGKRGDGGVDQRAAELAVGSLVSGVMEVMVLGGDRERMHGGLVKAGARDDVGWR